MALGDAPDQYDITSLREAILELTNQVEGLARIIEGWNPNEEIKEAIREAVAETAEYYIESPDAKHKEVPENGRTN